MQRIAVRCLGLFGLIEKKPNEELVKQLRLSFVWGPTPISMVACKALFDLGMWHTPHGVDRALGLDLSSQVQEDEVVAYSPVTLSNTDANLGVKLLDLLCAGLDKNDWGSILASDENESVQAVLGEGFAKILMLSENYPSIPTSLHPFLLTKLINLYFNNETKDLLRLIQFLFILIIIQYLISFYMDSH